MIGEALEGWGSGGLGENCLMCAPQWMPFLLGSRRLLAKLYFSEELFFLDSFRLFDGGLIDVKTGRPKTVVRSISHRKVLDAP